MEGHHKTTPGLNSSESVNVIKNKNRLGNCSRLKSYDDSTNFEDEGRGPGAKEWGWPQEGGEKAKKRIPPSSLQKEHSFADTLILAKWNQFGTFALQL